MRPMNFVAQPSCISPFNYIRCTSGETRKARDNKKKRAAIVSQVSVGHGSVKATVLIVLVEKRCLVCAGKWIKPRFPSLGKRVANCALKREIIPWKTIRFNLALEITGLVIRPKIFDLLTTYDYASKFQSFENQFYLPWYFFFSL